MFFLLAVSLFSCGDDSEKSKKPPVETLPTNVLITIPPGL